MAIPDVEISAVRLFAIEFKFIRQMAPTAMVQVQDSRGEEFEGIRSSLEG